MVKNILEEMINNDMNEFVEFINSQYGKPLKTFDWKQCEKIIEKNKIKNAKHGIEEDWDTTSDVFLKDGEYVESVAWLESTWGTPIIYDLDTDEEYECWYMRENPVSQKENKNE